MTAQWILYFARFASVLVATPSTFQPTETISGGLIGGGKLRGKTEGLGTKPPRFSDMGDQGTGSVSAKLKEAKERNYDWIILDKDGKFDEKASLAAYRDLASQRSCIRSIDGGLKNLDRIEKSGAIKEIEAIVRELNITFEGLKRTLPSAERDKPLPSAVADVLLLSQANLGKVSMLAQTGQIDHGNEALSQAKRLLNSTRAMFTGLASNSSPYAVTKVEVAVFRSGNEVKNLFNVSYTLETAGQSVNPHTTARYATTKTEDLAVGQSYTFWVTTDTERRKSKTHKVAPGLRVELEAP